MRIKVLCGLVAALGIAALTSFVILKETQKTTKIIPIHHKGTFGRLAYEIELKKTNLVLTMKSRFMLR